MAEVVEAQSMLAGILPHPEPNAPEVRRVERGPKLAREDEILVLVRAPKLETPFGSS